MEPDFWLVELLLEPLWRLVFWAVLLPPILVIVTPWALLSSFFGVPTYWLNVYTRYAAVVRWWGGLLRYA